jgi:hypothetical protein
MAKDGRSDLWVELAELASEEEDPEKLLALVAEINRLLEDRDNPARDRSSDVNREIARLLEKKRAFLKDGSTKKHTE